MIETIVSGLILAAISGLTFIAYKHPGGYKKIGTVTEGFVAISFIFYMIWTWGYQQGFYDGIKIEERFASPEYPIEPFPWLFIIVFIIQVFLRFLHNLPSILGLEDKSNDEG